MEQLLRTQDILGILTDFLDINYVCLTQLSHTIRSYFFTKDLIQILNRIARAYTPIPNFDFDLYRPPYELICSMFKTKSGAKLPLLIETHSSQNRCYLHIAKMPVILVEFYMRNFGLFDLFDSLGMEIITVVYSLLYQPTYLFMRYSYDLTFIVSLDMIKDNCSHDIRDIIYSNKDTEKKYKKMHRQRYISYQCGIHIECEPNHAMITYGKLSYNDNHFENILKLIIPIDIDTDILHMITLVPNNNNYDWVYLYEFTPDDKKIIKNKLKSI